MIDLSHTLNSKIPKLSPFNTSDGLKKIGFDISPHVTHENSKIHYNHKAGFSISTIQFESSVGTYIDFPLHRFPGEKSAGDFSIERFKFDLVVINIQDAKPKESVFVDLSSYHCLKDCAVIFRFNWSQYWGRESYLKHPFLDVRTIEALISNGVGLVGVDTPNIDNTSDDYRPAHTKLLAKEIFVVENLNNLHFLDIDVDYTLYCVPLPIDNAPSLPIRPFAIPK